MHLYQRSMRIDYIVDFIHYKLIQNEDLFDELPGIWKYDIFDFSEICTKNNKFLSNLSFHECHFIVKHIIILSKCDSNLYISATPFIVWIVPICMIWLVCQIFFEYFIILKSIILAHLSAFQFSPKILH